MSRTLVVRRGLTWSACLALAVAAGPATGVQLAFKTGPLDDAVRSAVRAQTLLYTLSEDSVNNGQRVLAAARSDYGRIVAAMYDLGYYAPVVSITLDGVEAAQIAPTRPPGRVKKVRVVIDPGAKFKLGTAEIGPLAEGTVLPEGFAPNRTARATVLREAASSALEGWQAQGYAKASIAGQDLTARHAEAKLDARITVDPGPQLRFGELVLSEGSAVREERIREIAGLPTGKIYDPALLEEAQNRLQRAGPFRAVRLTEADALSADGRLPIEAQVVDQKPRRFGFGAELSSREGLALSTFWLHRNFLGGAERLRFDAEVNGIGGNDGGEDFSLSARLDRPATFHPRMDLYLLATLEDTNDIAFEQQRGALEAGLTYRADSKRTFTGGVGAEFARSQDAFGTREYTLLTLPFTAEYDGRDNRLNPTNGYFGRAELTPFLGSGDVDSGARLHLDARAYRALDEAGRFVLAGRAQLGSVIGPSLDRAPTEMLFFSGGSQTVRGHGFQSLGIQQPGGLSGGASFAGLSAELRSKVTDSFSIVGFVDYGLVSDDPMPGSGTSLDHSGAGLGVRYDTGIGPLRLDVATPLQGAGDTVQIYIGIGQAF